MDGMLLKAVVLLPALVMAIVCHEVAHGWVALMLGDPTAKERRRLTLNPLRHADPVGTVLLPGALALMNLPIFGWARPVPVNKWRLRNPRFGMMAVAAAGPATNLLLAALASVALGLLSPDPQGLGALAGSSLVAFIEINIFLALFNLLPIPPFDGSHVVEGLLPEPLARGYAGLRPIGFPLLILLLVVLPYLIPHFDLIERVVIPPAGWVEAQFMALAGWVASAHG
jgi:Zn-dependent protease